MIKIQKDSFDIEVEISNVKKNLREVGAISTFIGYVREFNNNQKVNSINLEVYEKMAYQVLKEIVIKAKKKWSLIETLVIHRYGKLEINDKIVLVATFSQHRKNSLEACNFIMDYLKKEAPFWKKEYYNNNFSWLQNTTKKN